MREWRALGICFDKFYLDSSRILLQFRVGKQINARDFNIAFIVTTSLVLIVFLKRNREAYTLVFIANLLHGILGKNVVYVAKFNIFSSQ